MSVLIPFHSPSFFLIPLLSQDAEETVDVPMEPVTLPPIRHMLKALDDASHTFLASSITNTAAVLHSQTPCQAPCCQRRQQQQHHNHQQQVALQGSPPITVSSVSYQCFCQVCKPLTTPPYATPLPSPSLTPSCPYCSPPSVHPNHRHVEPQEPLSLPLTPPPASHTVIPSMQSATSPRHQRRYSRPFQQPPEIVFPAHPLHARRSEALPPGLWHQPRYPCHQCTKTFSRPSSLRIHMYTHTGEKPYKCHYPDCDRRFSVQSNMRRHARVHYAL